MKKLPLVFVSLLALAPLAASAQCVVELGEMQPGLTAWQVTDTVRHEFKGMGAYKRTVAPRPSSPLLPASLPPMAPADVQGLDRAIAAKLHLPEAQVAAMPHLPARMETTPDQPLSDLPDDERRRHAERGGDTTKTGGWHQGASFRIKSRH